MGWHPCCCEECDCFFCSDGAPCELEVTLTGLVDKPPAGFPPTGGCDNCEVFNDTFILPLIAGTGSPGETICSWRYHFSPEPCTDGGSGTPYLGVDIYLHSGQYRLDVWIGTGNFFGGVKQLWQKDFLTKPDCFWSSLDVPVVLAYQTFCNTAASTCTINAA